MKPPPLSNKQDIKKQIQKKLNHVFDQVAKTLCNSREISRVSYVHPQIINKWLEEIGVDPEMLK